MTRPTGPADDRMAALLEIMARLRDPDGGCPWDLAQDFASVAPYTIEEAYEVLDAIEQGEPAALCDELGDLLFQVVFHARMAEERGWFGFPDVVVAISDKLVRRHPHVFGDVQVADAGQQTLAWEAHKAAEREARGGAVRTGALDGVPLALPALSRAAKLQRRVARLGLDWPDWRGVLDKVREELAEIEAEVARGGEGLEGEIGDLLFACVNLARHLDVDAEAALRGANRKFERRVAWLEARLAEQGRRLQDADAGELNALWEAAKAEGL